MTFIYSVESLACIKNYSENDRTLVIRAKQGSGMNIEHCFSVRHYMGSHLEYLDDASNVYLVITLKHSEIRYAFLKPLDVVREYSEQIVELMGF